MRIVPTSIAAPAALLCLAHLAACSDANKAGASSASPSGAPASKASSSAAAAAAPTGGELDVKMDEKHVVKMKVGAAFVDLFPGDEDEAGKPGSYKFFIKAFNEGVKDATCDTEPKGDKAIGGNDWALTFDTINMDRWNVGSKDPLPLSPSFFYKDDSGPQGFAPWASVTMDKNEVHVESFSEKQVTFRIDMSNKGSGGDGWIRGKLTAKVCKIEK